MKYNKLKDGSIDSLSIMFFVAHSFPYLLPYERISVKKFGILYLCSILSYEPVFGRGIWDTLYLCSILPRVLGGVVCGQVVQRARVVRVQLGREGGTGSRTVHKRYTYLGRELGADPRTVHSTYNYIMISIEQYKDSTNDIALTGRRNCF